MKPNPDLSTGSVDDAALVLRHGSDLVVQSADGQLCLRVALVQQEFVVECLSGRMRLRSHEALLVEAPHLALNAQESLSLVSAGDMHLCASGKLSVTADAIALEAVSGDALIVANDDVRIDGERIRMNS
ncbi:hypothetical protein [Diaphorobacter aerolatus]|uniref:DUF2345 domain-containing protein n=1 Tax=Diaphorobacter aerolatus TaxID=1288495 RepID=A0A7H0GLJ7_9BURK|nr:hypothetical protein [Diaphorobacter aerolatus]QNP49163.1 hypothetical protein H9K75_03280 [Diaphorobacter aerolatus]